MYMKDKGDKRSLMFTRAKLLACLTQFCFNAELGTDAVRDVKYKTSELP